jgi:hypothetical protein
MLTMNARKRLCQVVIGLLLCGLPTVGFAKGARRTVPSTEEKGSQSTEQQSVGAPQVLEIPSTQETTPLSAETQPDSSPPSNERTAAPLPYEDTRSLESRTPVDEKDRLGETQPPASPGRRNYLGVLYATAEDGPVGVQVLDVIPGSPAARAGFQGSNAPPSHASDLVKIALVALTMSPIGPFAMPLIIAHGIYTANRKPVGDLIVAVGNQQVRDAVEFSQEMHNHQPGEQISFSVMRAGKPVQLTVQLEEEPQDNVDRAEERMRSSQSYQQRSVNGAPFNTGVSP